MLTGAARSTEVDDIDLPGCTTVGAVVVPVAVTMAAARPRVGEGALLSAVVSGYEAMTRLGRAIGGATLLYRGVWPTYVTAAFGAAATTARLLELDAAATASCARARVGAHRQPSARGPRAFRVSLLRARLRGG